MIVRRIGEETLVYNRRTHIAMLLGGASVLVPAPSEAAATCVPNGKRCNTSADCCSFHCDAQVRRCLPDAPGRRER